MNSRPCISVALEHSRKNTKASLLPAGFLLRSGVLDDVETTGVNSASSGSSPVILILQVD